MTPTYGQSDPVHRFDVACGSEENTALKGELKLEVLQLKEYFGLFLGELGHIAWFDVDQHTGVFAVGSEKSFSEARFK